MRVSALLLSGLMLAGLTCFASRCAAEDFRIETDVFVDDGKEPVVQTRTIFADGIVYDFLLTGVEEITVFDLDRKRLVLLDTQRKVKTELSLEGILSYVAQMRVQLTDGNHEFLLAAEMKATDAEDGWLELTNGRVTYRAEGTAPKSKETAAAYQQFADWYARLNAMREGNPPPFARIQLNAELASRGLIPQTIERTIVQKRSLPEKKQVLRSQHLANWRLSQTDRKQIDRAGMYLADFSAVSFREYLNLPEPDAAQEAAGK